MKRRLTFKTLFLYLFVVLPFLRKDRRKISRVGKTQVDEIPERILEAFQYCRNWPSFKYADYPEVRVRFIAEKNNRLSELRALMLIHPLSALQNDLEGFPLIREGDAFGAFLSRYQDYKFDFKSPEGAYISYLKKLHEDIDVILEEQDLKRRFEKTLTEMGNLPYIDLTALPKEKEEWGSDLARLKAYKRKYFNFSAYAEYEEIRQRHNEEYIRKNSHRLMDHSIGGHHLDEDQAKAILTEEEAVLVAAGAGSGKTQTILGKAFYLLSKGVDPSDILFLTYSRKSAEDLSRRLLLVDERLKASTFHALGLKVLREKTGILPLVEEQFEAIIKRFFEEEIFRDYEQMRLILLYQSELLGLGEVSGKRSYKEGTRDYRTLRGETVKSKEECQIADFYFLNGIRYEYERPYPVDLSNAEHRQYIPDFYLPDYDLYHEHYGFDANMRADHLGPEEGKRYIENYRWKQKVHRENGTICLETYSYQAKEGVLLKRLDAMLKEKGVVYSPLGEEEVARIFQEATKLKTYLSFIRNVTSFVALYKSFYPDEQGFEELKKGKLSLCPYLDLFRIAYRYYVDGLRKKGKIDFDDMILKATECLDKCRYRYVLVDEFQDMTHSRLLFLKKILEKGKARLFAVGDDFQSIYRFAGSDITIFTSFKKEFPNSAVCLLQKTYRNSQELLDLAGSFIMKNPLQVRKSLHSDIHVKDPIVIHYHYDREGRKKALAASLESLRREGCRQILLLGRNNFDLDLYLDERGLRVAKADDNFIVYHKAFKDLKLSFLTVHRSKGLEADGVILLNGDGNLLGFPNAIEDFPYLSAFLAEDEVFPFGEERRLFYVALTRTRGRIHILASGREPSIFVEELGPEVLEVGRRTRPVVLGACPRCGNGALLLKEAPDGRRYISCSNYPKCHYYVHDVEKVLYKLACPYCGDVLVVRRDPRGRWFLGCHSYPSCRFSDSLYHVSLYQRPGTVLEDLEREYDRRTRNVGGHKSD